MIRVFSSETFSSKRSKLQGDRRVRDSFVYLFRRSALMGGGVWGGRRADNASLFLLNSNRSVEAGASQLARNVLRLRLLTRFEQFALALAQNREVADGRTFKIKALAVNFQKKISAKLQRLEVLRYQLQMKEKFDEEQQELAASILHGAESPSELQRRFLRVKLRNYIYKRAAKARFKKTSTGGVLKGGDAVVREQSQPRYSVRLGSLAEGAFVAWWRSDWRKGVHKNIVQKPACVPLFLRNQYFRRRGSWPIMFWRSQMRRSGGRFLGTGATSIKNLGLVEEETENQFDFFKKNSSGEGVQLPSKGLISSSTDWVGLSIPTKGWLATVVSFRRVGFLVRRRAEEDKRLLSVFGVGRLRFDRHHCGGGVGEIIVPSKGRLACLANKFGYLRSFAYRSEFCQPKIGVIATSLNRGSPGAFGRVYGSRVGVRRKAATLVVLGSVQGRIRRCGHAVDLFSTVRARKCWRAAAFAMYRGVLGVGSKKSRGWREFQGGLGLGEFRVNSGRSQGEKRAVKRGRLTLSGLQQFRSLVSGLDWLGGQLSLRWFGYMPHRLISKAIGSRLQTALAAFSKQRVGCRGRCVDNIFEISKAYRVGLNEIRSENALKDLKQLTNFAPLRFVLANRLRGLPYRLYVTGRKKSIFYAIVDGLGRSIFTFSSGMVAKVRSGRGSVGLRGVITKKGAGARVRKVKKPVSRINFKSRRTPSGLGRRIRKTQLGRKPRGVKRRGGLDSKRRRAKLYFELFKHHLRPLVSFLVGGGLLAGIEPEDQHRRWCQLVIVVRGVAVMRKITRRIVLELVKVLTRSNRCVYSYLEERYGVRTGRGSLVG